MRVLNFLSIRDYHIYVSRNLCDGAERFSSCLCYGRRCNNNVKLSQSLLELPQVVIEKSSRLSSSSVVDGLMAQGIELENTVEVGFIH